MSELANSTQEVNKTKNEEEKFDISVQKKFPFDANIKSCFMNTIEAAEYVDALFGAVLRDYVGCKINYNDGSDPRLSNEVPIGKMYVTLYFKEMPDNKEGFANVSKRADTSGKTRFGILMSMSSQMSSRMYDINEKTFDILNKFRFFSTRKANWNNLTGEIASSFGFVNSYNQEIVAYITGLDLEKIFSEIYGTRTDEGVFQYQALPVQIVANASGEYVLQITQLDVNKLNDLRKSLGGPVERAEFHQYIS